ncbi:fungal hydrophobin [Dichomitus squalens LYAD-421 SS1]|uniref:Hydrophobin n=1 Tax=Dichomitus squalens (strain LYAD-421) TaxID=732165 RepID=R7SSP5_DICSQ|nr:fungal hydrophobin [Dichomitus squalens LYAD-421 SS1]EJF58017.1 fungal hydrophobin [Dichomitus squalens LYAD-421 SS1]
MIAIVSLPLLAAANSIEARQSCSTGDLQCCESTETIGISSTSRAGSPAGAALLGLLGVVVQDANVLLGINCSPITVIGVGTGSSSSAQAVCCVDNSHAGGLVSIGCVPVSL